MGKTNGPETGETGKLPRWRAATDRDAVALALMGLGVAFRYAPHEGMTFRASPETAELARRRARGAVTRRLPPDRPIIERCE